MFNHPTTLVSPLNHKNPLEICGPVLHVDPPPPSSINDQLGPAHDELCRQLLAKRPDDRVQTGEEALRLLDQRFDCDFDLIPPGDSTVKLQIGGSPSVVHVVVLRHKHA